MREDSPQWHEVGQPASPAEAEALRAIKAMLPDASLTWAWSNLSFIGVNGRLAETDLLLLTRAGLTLVELKGWHGRITGNQQSWVVGGNRHPNPLFNTDMTDTYGLDGANVRGVPELSTFLARVPMDSSSAMDACAFRAGVKESGVWSALVLTNA